MDNIDLINRLINITVTHREYGEGTIIEIIDNLVIVKFMDDQSIPFLFPGAFLTKHLTFKNPSYFSELKQTEDKNVMNRSDKGYIKFKDSLISDMKNKKLALNTFLYELDNEEYYNHLRRDAISIIYSTKGNPRYITLDKKLVVIAFLAMVAFKFYNGNFWDHVRDELKSLYIQYNNQQQLENVIRLIISDEFDNYSNLKITNALVHAAVPYNSIKKFFYFVYDIYRLNFGYRLDGLPLDEMVEITLNGVSKLLKNTLDNDNIDFNISENDNDPQKITKKTYTLIKSTKIAIINYSKEMVNIIRMMLEMINDWYYNNLTANEYPAPFKISFDEWILENKERLEQQRKYTTKTEYVTRPLFKIRKEDKIVLLVLPVIILKNIDKENLFKVEVMISDSDEITKLVFNKDYRILERIGYYSLDIFKIKIKKPLNGVKLEIKVEDEIIYTSGDSLNRDIMIFDQEGNERFNYKEYQGLTYIIYNKATNYSGNITRMEFYNVAVLMSQKDESYLIGNQIICLSSVMKPGIYGEIINQVLVHRNDHEIKLFKKVTYFVFESEHQLDELDFTINDRKVLISSDDKIILKRGIYFNYRIALNWDENDKGVKTIKIYNNNRQELKSETFILDPYFDFQVIKFNMEDMLLEYRMDSSLVLNIQNREKLDVSTHDMIRKCFSLGFDNIIYNIDPKIDRFKFDTSSDWILFDSTDFKSNKLIISSNVKKCEILNANNNILFESLPLVNKNGSTEIDISYFSQLRKGNDFVKIKVIFMDDRFNEMKVYLRPTVISCNTMSLNSHVSIDFNIMEFKKDALKLIIKKQNEIIYDKTLTDTLVNINQIEPFEKHYMYVIQKENLFLGTNHRELYKQTLVYYNYNHLESHSFNLNDIILWNQDVEQKINIRNQSVKFNKKIENINIDGNDNNLYEITCSWKNEPIIAKVDYDENLYISFKIGFSELQSIGAYIQDETSVYNNKNYSDIDYYDDLDIDLNLDKFVRFQKFQEMKVNCDKSEKLMKILYMLGKAYMLGEGVEKSRSIAYSLWEESASLGNIEAMVSLANSYYSGSGISQNEELKYKNIALKFYESAAKMGHPIAKEKMELLQIKIPVILEIDPRKDFIK
ncbi:Sel1 repeat [Acholeplasma oculi]|uniref:Tetratricopeptide-like helical domain containing protein with Sel1-like repeat n=1 Tax=Acholeplasma oculi TaxID=35623 RepID=A0A061AA53_9MOLU|nr:tetratricopeptide repeat protein [Acholeplasma oculi]CDR30264.1 Tetratricopeptide-like helical domain containing protein with Sel1-like repeat [Acholeplasma oculi]SKC43437.1 Sel1 repeat-containing protein [Acholeplasma oculi]SUT88684.1 Sel1 repeat [Acholeplasma oculi]